MYSSGRDPFSMGYTSEASNLNVSSDNASVDLISSARQLEQHFKEKYKSLRTAYMQRVRQLADVVTDTCAGLFTDEMLEEMKGDKLSITFIPSHINEIIERHLDSERELFIHQTVDRCSTLEVDLSKATNMIRSQQLLISKNDDEIVKLKRFEVTNLELVADLKARNSKIQDCEIEAKKLSNKIFELEDLSMNSSETIERMRSDLLRKESENSQLQEAVQEARAKILQYEESLERKAHDLEELELAEYNERSLREDLKEELTTRSKQNGTQQAEINDLRIDIRFLKEALERKDADLQAKLQEERRTRDKVDALMEQVEGMLTQEAKISNATIEAMHEKMKILRHRLAQDIAREKRVSAALQDELSVVKAIKDDKVRELKVFVEEESRLRATLLTEQQANSALNKETQRLAKAITEGKMMLLAAESDAKALNDRVAEMERRMGDEIRLAEERARLEASKDYAEERRKLEETHSVYRLQVQSQVDLNVSRSLLGLSQPPFGAETLRHSYPSSVGESPQRQATGTVHGAHDMRHSYSFGQSAPFGAFNPAFLNTQGPQFFNNMNMDSGNNGYMKVVNDLKDQLADSYDNIDELKRILTESRKAVDEQQKVNEDLRAKVLAAQHQQQSMHKVTERLAAATASPIVSSTSIETTKMLEQSQTRVQDLERQLLQMSGSTAMALASSNGDYANVTEEMEKLADMKRQQIMYLEDINKKNNVINALNDRLLESNARVAELHAALDESQNQAMRDQASDMLLISDMQRKFESLMNSYESSSSSSDVKSAERIAALESLLQAREEELAHAHSGSSSSDVKSAERIAALESQLQAREEEPAHAKNSLVDSSDMVHKFTEDRSIDIGTLRAASIEDSDLRQQAKRLKDILFTVVEGYSESRDFFEWDVAKIGEAVEQRMASSRSRDVEATSSSSDSSTNTTAEQASSAATQTTTASTSSAATNTALHSAVDALEAATGALRSPAEAVSETISLAGNIYADLHDSAERVYRLETELADSTSRVSDLCEWKSKGAMCIISYDSALKGLLAALAASELMSKERSDDLYRKYRPPHAQQVATFEDTAISASIRSDIEDCLRAGGRTNEELVAVRNEHKLLLELSRMESDATIKALEERTKDLIRDHEVETSVLRSELANIESSLRKALDVELAGCRSDELSRSAAMASKLKAEQSRRQHLHASLEEMEKNYNQMAAQLSDALVRAEAAENELIKSRFKL